jgi:MFS family permease
MICAAAVSMLAYLGYIIFSDSLTAIIICRIMQGVAFAFMSVARTAFATDYMPRDRIGEGVAFTSFGIVLSQAIGPAMGMWIQEQWGFQACFIVALCLSLLSFALLTTRPYTHVPKKFNWNKLRLYNLVAVDVLPFALIGGLFSMQTQLGNAFIPLIADERGITNVALYFTVFSLVSLALRPFVGKTLDKYGLSVLLFPAFVFGAITFVLTGIAWSLLIIVIAAVAKAFSQGVAMPAIQGATIKRLGRERAGVASATIHMGQDLMNMLAPMFGGALAGSVGYGNMYYTFAGIILLGIPAYAYLHFRDKKRSAAV